MMIGLESILTGINQKDEKSWKMLYHVCYRALCVYTESLVHDMDNAKDIVQEVLVSIWGSELYFSNSRELLSYLYKAVYHKSLTFIRNQKKRKEILDMIMVRENVSEECEQDYFLLRVVQEEVMRLLYLHVEDLPSMRRKVIELSMNGFSNKEVADYLGISINTVKVQKNKSLKFLRERLMDAKIEYSF